MDHHDAYQYEILQAKHANQTVNMMAQAFCEQEPMTKYLDISLHEFIPLAKQSVDKAIHDGLSIVALARDTVIACTLVEDFADPLNITIDIDPRFRFIFALLDHLGRDYFSQKDFEKGHIAHLFMTAIDKKYRGKGLSNQLHIESIKLSQKKNFDFMCCELTHQHNENEFINDLKNKKLLIKSCPYKDFNHEGRKPFENLDGIANAYIWELKDGVKLRYRNRNQELMSTSLSVE